MLAPVPLVLSLRRHRTALLAAAACGLWTALAVTASHLASLERADPYLDNDLDALSWVLMLSVICTAAVLAAAGIRAASRGARERRASAEWA